jgi:hypothetical protein
MDSDDYSTEQWQEQQHAEAVELLQEANYYVLITVDSKGKIKLLDGCTGKSISFRNEHCMLSMLEGFATYSRTALEADFQSGKEDDRGDGNEKVGRRS